MKKLLLVMLLLFTLIACEKDKDVIVYEPQLISLETYVIADISEGVQLEKNRDIAYVYSYIIGYDNDEPIYNKVASALVFEVGDEITVAHIELESFDYKVIQLENGLLDTSWHKYLERV